MDLLNLEEEVRVLFGEWYNSVLLERWISRAYEMTFFFWSIYFVFTSSFE